MPVDLPRTPDIPWACEDCEFDTDGLGHIPHNCCANFIMVLQQLHTLRNDDINYMLFLQCQKLEGFNNFIEHVMCCPDGLYWHQDVETCLPLAPQAYDPYCDMECKENCTYTFGECTFSILVERTLYMV